VFPWIVENVCGHSWHCWGTMCCSCLLEWLLAKWIWWGNRLQCGDIVWTVGCWGVCKCWVYCRCCILGRPEDVHVCVLLVVHDIGDSWIVVHIWSRGWEWLQLLTVMGHSSTHQRPVRGQWYPVRTAVSVMLIVLES
jgi:hypothetical protein